MTENYVHWHAGVELDEQTQTWRGYIADNDYRQKHLTTETFTDKGDAVIAASAMLARARKGEPPA